MANKNLPHVSVPSTIDTYMRVLLYGATGAGKTLTAASAARHPELRPVLFLNFDDGLSSITHIEGLHEVRIKSINEMLAVVGQLVLPEAEREEEYRGFKTLVIDSLSAWRDATMNELVSKAVASKQRAEMTTQIQDFGQMSFTLASVIQGLRQQPFHLIFTAGLDQEIEGDVIQRTMPLMQPKLRESVSYMMSFIWYMAQKNGEYRMLTLPRGVHTIKTRNPRFVRAIQQETLKRAKAKLEPDSKKDPSGSVGWWDMELDDNDIPTPGIDTLYELFKISGAKGTTK